MEVSANHDSDPLPRHKDLNAPTMQAPKDPIEFHSAVLEAQRLRRSYDASLSKQGELCLKQLFEFAAEQEDAFFELDHDPLAALLDASDT